VPQRRRGRIGGLIGMGQSAATTLGTGLLTLNATSLTWGLLAPVCLAAVAVGFLLGMFLTWRGLFQRAPQRAVQTVAPAPTSAEPPAVQTSGAWPGPPPEAPPPTEI